MNTLVQPPAGFRRVEILAMSSLPFLVLALAWHLAPRATPAMVGLSFLVGFLFADFGSGVVHWFFDTWLTTETPVVGRAFVRTFREHHVDPSAICRHDFVDTNASNTLAACIIVCVGWLVSGDPVGDFVAAALLVTAVFTAVTSQIHKWAHMDRVPRWVAWLQRSRLVLSKEAHARHHFAPYDRGYCITTGWMNPTLDVVRFFPAMETVVRRASRAGRRC